MHIELPAVHVAVENSSKVNLTLEYAQEDYHYPAGSVTTVPFEIAHKHFGFEFDDNGRLYRNTDRQYSDGQETQFYFSRACILPWGWQHDETPLNKKEPNGKTRQDYFEELKDAYELGISAKVIQFSKKLSKAQYDALPA